MLWPPPRPSCTEVITRTAWTLGQLQKLLVTSHNKTLYFKLIASLHHSNEHALIFNNTIPPAVEPPRQGPDLIHSSAALVGLQGPGVPELLHLRRKRLEDHGPLSAEQQQGFPQYERMMGFGGNLTGSSAPGAHTHPKAISQIRIRIHQQNPMSCLFWIYLSKTKNIIDLSLFNQTQPSPRHWNEAQAQRGDAQRCQAGSQQLHHGTLELRPCTPTSHSRSQQHLIRFTATQQGQQNLTKRLSNSKLAMVGGIQLKMVSNCSFICLTWMMKLMMSLILVETE